MLEKHTFGGSPITAHAWNGDRTRLALSLNGNQVFVYRRNPSSGWTLEFTMKEHGLLVTGIDWAPKSNRIVTCSADRNAYVWTEKANGGWEPTLVLLRINRAATCVRWSPNENKFAVGSGSKLISVCYFEDENNWWVSKHIKKPIQSTVTTLDWHPNNILLAAGGSDFKVRVFSAYIRDIEPKPSPTAWGSKMPLGQLMSEHAAGVGGGGWVHAVEFSEDGSKLAWVAHDSSISVVTADSSNNNVVACHRSDHLPYRCVKWLSASKLVAGGFDYRPVVFQLAAADKLQLIGSLDMGQKRDVGGVSAMRKFQSLDKQSRSEQSDNIVNSVHQNNICGMSVYKGARGTPQTVCTSSLDGQLVMWNVQSLPAQLAKMEIR